MFANKTASWIMRKLMLLCSIGLLPGLQSQLAAQQWVTTWGDSPAGPPPNSSVQYGNQTRRLIVHPSVGGSQVRVKFSNLFGTVPLTLGEVHIAQSGNQTLIVPSTDTKLTFSRQTSVTIQPGDELVSDPANFKVIPFTNVSISYYLPAPTIPTTTHVTAFQTSWVDSGNVVSSPSMPTGRDIPWWDFLTGLQVNQSSNATDTVVAFGNSITDGVGSTLDANRRWPDDLAKILQTKGLNYGVVNAGISGNRLLHDSAVGNLYGPSGLSRFDRDALQVPGVEYVIVLIDINDIGQPGVSAPLSEAVTVGDLEYGYFLLSLKARISGAKIFIGTLTPFGASEYYSPGKEQQRQDLNAWIRSTSRFGLFDGVIDFDAAVRDPNNPTKLSATADSGDHLHLSDAGYAAMATTAYSTLTDLNWGNRNSFFNF